MAIFLRASLAYLFVALVLTAWLNHDPLASIRAIMAAAFVLLNQMAGLATKLCRATDFCGKNAFIPAARGVGNRTDVLSYVSTGFFDTSGLRIEV